MKGLLLKDWYALKSYCRANLLIIVAFAIAGGVMKGNFFFTYYPCICAGVITMSLMAYEEREKWEQYAATLPYTKAQMVSSKYTVSLCLGAFTVLLNIIIQLICMMIFNTYDISRLLSLIITFVPFALLPASFLLPFIFKFGVNKGRIAYYIVLAVFCGAVGVMVSIDTIGLTDTVSTPSFSSSGILLIISLIVYALSWGLSIFFYKNREI